MRTAHARQFYEAEALRGGWTVRQLRRQIDSQFYERTALSRNKAAMLRKGAVAKPADAVSAAEEIKSPYVLEFLDLKDEYEGLHNQILAAEYRTALPDEKQIAAELEHTREALEGPMLRKPTRS